MVCVGLPVKPTAPSASADNIIAIDEHDKPYSLGNPLKCGKGIYFKVHVSWQNCSRINLKITCGDHGTAKTLLNANVNLPYRYGSGWITIRPANGKVWSVDSILNACGYSCTSKQAFFCAEAKVIG